MTSISKINSSNAVNTDQCVQVARGIWLTGTGVADLVSKLYLEVVYQRCACRLACLPECWESHLHQKVTVKPVRITLYPNTLLTCGKRVHMSMAFSTHQHMQHSGSFSKLQGCSHMITFTAKAAGFIRSSIKEHGQCIIQQMADDRETSGIFSLYPVKPPLCEQAEAWQEVSRVW